MLQHCACTVEPAAIGLCLLDAAILPRCVPCHVEWQEYNASHNGDPAVSVIASAPENLKEVAALSHGQMPPAGPKPPVSYCKMSPKLVSQAKVALKAGSLSLSEFARRITHHRPDLFVFEEAGLNLHRLSQLFTGKPLREEIQQPLVKAVKEWLAHPDALTALPDAIDAALRAITSRLWKPKEVALTTLTTETQDMCQRGRLEVRPLS